MAKGKGFKSTFSSRQAEKLFYKLQELLEAAKATAEELGLVTVSDNIEKLQNTTTNLYDDLFKFRND